MEISYMNTNENLGAIVAGLQISLEDTVVAVGGSGEQAFALLEHAGRVKVFDINPVQLAYIRRRAEALEKGDYNGFMPRRTEYKDCLERSDWERSDLERRRSEQFLLGRKGRIDKIRQKLPRLEIAEEGDIMELVQQEQKYSRAYLSNTIGFCENHRTPGEIKECLKKVAEKLAEGGLIYVSNHDWLVQLSDRRRSSLPPFDLETTSFLPTGLRLDFELSLLARTHESRWWAPAVYQKVKP